VTGGEFIPILIFTFGANDERALGPYGRLPVLSVREICVDWSCSVVDSRAESYNGRPANLLKTHAFIRQPWNHNPNSPLTWG